MALAVVVSDEVDKGRGIIYTKGDNSQSLFKPIPQYNRQKVPSGPRLAKGTWWSKVGKEYLVVQGWHRVPSKTRFGRG